MDEKCAVPNCKNSTTVGIPFPKQSDLLEKWLNSLGIPDFVPTESNFVCLHHFGNNCLLDHVTDLENALEVIPVPVPTLPEIKNEETEICRFCMKSNSDKLNVEAILDLVNSYLPEIEISKNDGLSHWVCANCYKILHNFDKFREVCLKLDKKQRNNLKKKRKLEVENVIPQKQIKTDIDKKFDQIEEELMKALEEKIPEEMRSADNIIIEVQSDDENELINQKIALISENVLKVGSDELRLPKGIKVSLNQSKVCNFETIVENNIEFCLIEGYLFEYRLCKGNIRHLRCLVPKCKSTAQQTTNENKVLLKGVHSHPLPTSDDRKKQIFLHLMRRKMQSDKSLNFRSIYEEFCEKNPELKRLVPLKSVINQICCQQVNQKLPGIHSFQQFFNLIENDEFQKLHFTQTNQQFYQEKFAASDGAKAVVFANRESIHRHEDSKLMYVDASFKLDNSESFNYHLVTVLVWVADSSFYPIMFALISQKSQELYRLIFSYLHDSLAPFLRPDEIVTDYEASLYYSLGEVYLNSNIGGSVFYYTQNLYKKICSLNLSRELETNFSFRNIYHMLLMLPLLPVNTIVAGLNNIEMQATELGQIDLAAPIIEHVKSEWINKVTPELFCVHRLENRINENVIAPFKKLRDFMMLSKGKMCKQQINIVAIVEKIIELEGFLSGIYSASSKRSFARDLSSSQKRNVLRAWQFIENHPKININNFFTRVLGYIKCMENQLWIWGFYRHKGDTKDELINAENFSIVNNDDHNYQTQFMDYVYTNDKVVVMGESEEILERETQERQVLSDLIE